MSGLKREIGYLAVFVALTCLYFNDVFLKSALLTVEDGFQYYYPVMISMTEQYRNFMFPFWNPLEYSGFPMFAAMEAGALYPFNVLLPLLLEPVRAFNLNLMLHFALAGFFTFLYVREIGAGVFASLVSGAVFSFLGYLPAHLNHQSVINAAVWIPLILYLYERLRKEGKIKYALYAGLAIGLQVFAGHPQISFYTGIVLVLYVLFHFFYQGKPQRLKFALSCALSLALGILIALPQIIASRELSAMADRTGATYEFFSSYAFPIHKIPTLVFPFFYYYGGSQRGEMWGPVPDLGQEAFIGALPFLLSLLVIVKWKKNPYILFWGALAALAFALSLGDGIPPLNRLLYRLPGYNAFRGASKHMLEVSFALSVLAGFGISFLQERGRERRFNTALVTVLAAAIVASSVVFLFFDDSLRAFFKGVFSGMSHFQLRWERADIPEKALSISDASISTPIIIMSVCLGCVLAYLKAKKKALQTLFLAGIFAVIFVEALLWKMTDIPHRDDVENYNRALYSTLSAAADGRTVFLDSEVPPLTALPYGIRLVEGYESLETGDYTKIFPRMYAQPPRVWRSVLENNSVLSMMNAKYLAVSSAVGGVVDIKRRLVTNRAGVLFPLPPVAGIPQTDEYRPVYRKIGDYGRIVLYENLLVLPRAYSVMTLKPVDSADDLRRGLFSYRIYPWNEAAVSTGDLREIGAAGFSPGYVRIQEERPDRVALSTRFRGEGFVVLSDRFYPGWEARIDGTRTTIYRTNSVFRGVIVPEGDHTIVFEYVPRLIYAAMAFSGALLAGMLFVIFRSDRSSLTRP
ncbi:MAG: YfhO family protein [Nitrospirae bacterium]|nr:YfhO family protein [Nitrospirota bacterium]